MTEGQQGEADSPDDEQESGDELLDECEALVKYLGRYGDTLPENGNEAFVKLT